ncbi:MAG: hypothetical protein AAF791_14730 [Bacteroidota bacterium]
MLRLAALVGFVLVLSSCDTAEEPPPQATQFIRGTYIASWTLNETTDRERIAFEHDLLVRMQETEGVVEDFPGSAGSMEVVRSVTSRQTGTVVNRRFLGADVETVSGTYNRDTRAFDLRIQGIRGSYVFDVTFVGAANLTYTQLTGLMQGRLYHTSFPNDPSGTVEIDQQVTLQKQ